jgi:N-acetylglucosaminyl-diphospho-decaprenol L-rhamnosyltransferase
MRPIIAPLSARPDPASAVDVSILIVNYQCGAYLAACLASLFATPPRCSFEVIVLDNASSDDSVTRAKALGLPVTWKLSAENTGFGAGNNLAAAAATGTFLLLLNPDTIVVEDSITPLWQYCVTHPDVGLAGGHHESGDGAWQLSFGFPLTVWHEFEYAFAPRRFWGRLPGTSPEEPAEVGWLAGSFLMIPRALVERIGLFDDGFFLNDEDIDLALRVREAGYRVVYVPVRGLRHFGGVSRPFLENEPAAVHRSRRYLYRKHYGWWAAAVFEAARGIRRGRDWISRRRTG